MLQFTTKLNDLIWSKPMLFLILGAGIFFTIATRAVQFRKIKDMFHIMIDGKKSETGVSSVQAFMISAAGRVGTSLAWLPPSPSVAPVPSSGCGWSPSSAVLPPSLSAHWRRFTRYAVRMAPSSAVARPTT